MNITFNIVQWQMLANFVCSLYLYMFVTAEESSGDSPINAVKDDRFLVNAPERSMVEPGANEMLVSGQDGVGLTSGVEQNQLPYHQLIPAPTALAKGPPPLAYPSNILAPSNQNGQWGSPHGYGYGRRGQHSYSYSNYHESSPKNYYTPPSQQDYSSGIFTGHQGHSLLPTRQQDYWDSLPSTPPD